MKIAGVGQFYAWGGGCLFIGRSSGIVPRHAHHAMQLVFPTEGTVQLTDDLKHGWIDFEGALVHSRQPHLLGVSGGVSAILFVEPETREGRILQRLYPDHAIAPLEQRALAASRELLFGAWERRESDSGIVMAAREVVSLFAGGAEPAVVTDDRILRAIDHIVGNLRGNLSLDDVAAVACLSPSRFRHLFVEQTGSTLRQYILWKRMLAVWGMAASGRSLSAAAHGAGFADASHFTRTCRRMFGIAPSALQVDPERV